MNNKLDVRKDEIQLQGLGFEMDQMFDQMVRAANAPFGLFSSHPFGAGEFEDGVMLKPKLDISGDEQAFHVSLEVPGVDEKDLKVELRDKHLIISGEKKREIEEGNAEKGMFHMERSFGSFRRVISVPEDILPDDIRAAYQNGVLNIEIPRREKVESKPRKIEITKG